MKRQSLTIPYRCGAIPLPQNDVWMPSLDANGNEIGEITARGPWQIISSYRALVVSGGIDDKPLTIHGHGTLTNCKQSGYELEGKVSVNGKKVRGFTTSVLFELPNGKLCNVAAIHACLPK